VQNDSPSPAYFVRSSPNGPEKGPYELEVIRSSHEQGLLKLSALARPEGEDEVHFVAELLGLPVPEGARKTAEVSAALPNRATADAARAAVAPRPQRPAQASTGSPNLMIGVVMLAAGVILSVLTYSAASESGGGRYVVFTGLIAFGIVRIVRGLA